MIKATTGKYLSVQEGRVVLKSEPFKFKVLFHGVNRRIISLYVPNQGYVVMSRKQPCLFVTKSGAGKYFIVDFENLQNTLIKSLVHMEKVPESWGMPSNDELRELKEVNSLLMREQVTLSGEEYIERELVCCGSLLKFYSTNIFRRSKIYHLTLAPISKSLCPFLFVLD